MNHFKHGYAVVVGIANYVHLNWLSPVVVQDAVDFSTLLQDPAYANYMTDHVRMICNEDATAQILREALHWLATTAQPSDTVIIFFSGHGGQITEGTQPGYYLLTVDSDWRDLNKTAIESAEFIALLDQIKAERLVLLLDCCHAGGVGGAKDGSDLGIPGYKAGFDDTLYYQLATGEGRVVITSSKEDEKSWILPDMNNSLFTHYMLKALKGEAKTYDDGVVGVLDIFNYVSATVPDHAQQFGQQQHPLLKATAANNFPLVLHQLSQLTDDFSGKVDNIQAMTTRIAIPDVTIDDPHGLLSKELTPILQKTFVGYTRIIAGAEFGQGFSGGRVFLIHPIRVGGTRELSTVIKVGAVSLIEKEWQAYLQQIKGRLPKSIGIQEQPVLPLESGWGALRYAMAGDGVFPVTSLRNYCQQQSLADVQFVIEQQLLPTIDALHRQHHVSPAFSIQDALDPVLPLNLLIEPMKIPTDVEPFLLTPENYLTATLTANIYIRLEGFIIVKVDLQDDTVTLNLPQTSSTIPPKSFVIRLSSVGALQSLGVNQIMLPIEGRVKTTRAEQLHDLVKAVVGGRFRPEEDMISMMDGREFPNPVKHLPDILHQFLDVKVSTIHGDLNLENCLVHLDTRSISLIDFSEAREDYTLLDFFRLETEIVVKLVATALAEANLGAGVICDFYQQLHQAIVNGDEPTSQQLNSALEKPFTLLVALRKAAHTYLLKRDEWGEYYHGMVVFLLGALKFGSLEKEDSAPMPKQAAVWGAAALLGLVDDEVQPLTNGHIKGDQTSSKETVNWEKVRTTLLDDSSKQARFVDTLLRCPSMSNPSARDSLVDGLPFNLKVRIRRSNIARVDLVNIVGTTLVYANGLEDLVTKLREFESNDLLTMQSVDKFIESLL